MIDTLSVDISLVPRFKDYSDSFREIENTTGLHTTLLLRTYTHPYTHPTTVQYTTLPYTSTQPNNYYTISPVQQYSTPTPGYTPNHTQYTGGE